MKASSVIIVILGTLLTLSAKPIRADSILPYGQTIIKKQIDGNNVVVEFWTHQVNIGKPTKIKRSILSRSCTYSHFPCVILDDLRIFVEGRQLYLRRSVTAALSDLLTAEIGKHGEDFVLTLKGGDASEGYKVEVEFSKTEVKLRRLYGAFDPDKILEETVYHRSVSEE